MVYINEAIADLLDEHKPAEIAKTLEVTQAMVSTWKKKENDFTPRISVAAKIYTNYEVVVWPYDVEALIEVAEHDAIFASREH